MATQGVSGPQALGYPPYLQAPLLVLHLLSWRGMSIALPLTFTWITAMNFIICCNSSVWESMNGCCQGEQAKGDFSFCILSMKRNRMLLCLWEVALFLPPEDSRQPTQADVHPGCKCLSSLSIACASCKYYKQY